MKLKENDIIPNEEIFILEEGEPKKNILKNLLKIKKLFYLVYKEHILQFVPIDIYQAT